MYPWEIWWHGKTHTEWLLPCCMGFVIQYGFCHAIASLTLGERCPIIASIHFALFKANQTKLTKKKELNATCRWGLQQCWWSKVQPPCRLWQRHTPWKSQWRRWISSPAAAKQQLSTGKKPLPLIILLHFTDILYISQLHRTYICTNQGLASWKQHRIFAAPVSWVHLLGQRGPTILQVDFGLDDVDDNNNGVVLDTSTFYDLDECADGDVDDTIDGDNDTEENYRVIVRDTSSSYRPALPQERALPLCSEVPCLTRFAFVHLEEENNYFWSLDPTRKPKNIQPAANQPSNQATK